MAGYGLTLVTAPAVEPVTVEEVKIHSRIDFGDEDQRIEGLITAARQYCERATARQLCTATWDLWLDCFPLGNSPLLLPFPPLQSVSFLKYYDTANTLQTWSAANYVVSSSRTPGRLSLAYGVSWPAVYNQADAVNVRFAAGYGAATSVPAGIKQAIYLLVGQWFENREATTGKTMPEAEFAVCALLEQYKIGDEFTSYDPRWNAVYAGI